MNCEPYLDLISARLDGELTQEEAQALSEHLRECPHCRAIAEELACMHSAAASLGEVDVPPELHQTVMSRIKAEKKNSGGRIVRRLSVLAACLVLCVGVLHMRAPVPAEDPLRSAPMPLTLADTRTEHYAFSNEQYISVTWGSTPEAPGAQIIGSEQSLSEYLAQFPRDDLSHLAQTYDRTFFDHSRLLAVVVEEPSSSIRHTLAQQGLLADSVSVLRHVPEVGDCVMAAWLILAEVDDSFADGQRLIVVSSD